MFGLSTITQKGQIVIPQPIRDALQLKASTRVYLEAKDNAILVKPALTVQQALGMIRTDKHAQQKDYDRVIRKSAIKKYQKKLHGIS